MLSSATQGLADEGSPAFVALLNLLAGTAAFWGLLHGIAALIRTAEKGKKRAGSNGSILPLRSPSFLSSSSNARFGSSRLRRFIAGSSVTLTALTLRMETKALNRIPMRFCKAIGARPSSSSSSSSSSSRRSSTRFASRDSEEKKMDLSSPHGRLTLFYDVGWLAAAVAAVGAVLMLVLGGFRLFRALYELAQTSRFRGDIGMRRPWAKRGLGGDKDQAGSLLGAISITPLIPGVTVPWSDGFLIIAALLCTSFIHEIGHAMAAVLSGIQPLRMGFMLIFPAIPSAFVVLPRRATDGFTSQDDDHDDAAESYSPITGSPRLSGPSSSRLSVRARARIVSAGVWHNLVSAVTIGGLLWLGVGAALSNSVWLDKGGMVVSWIDAASPLVQHIEVGSTIVALDDVDLSPTRVPEPQARIAAWNRFILGDDDEVDGDGVGWCVADRLYQAAPSDCCSGLGQADFDRQGKSGNSMCFLNAEALRSPGHCLDIFSLFDVRPPPSDDGARGGARQLDARAESADRCVTSCSTGPGGAPRTCVKLHPSEHLVRITFVPRSTEEDGSSSKAEVILFQGPRASLDAAFEVLPLVPRWGWLPLPYTLARTTYVLAMYLLNLSIALALFNVLPVKGLDGDVLLGLVGELWLVNGLGMRRRAQRMPSRSSSSGSTWAAAIEEGIDEPALEIGADSAKASLDSHFQSDLAAIARFKRRVRWWATTSAISVFGGTTLLFLLRPSPP